MTTPTRSVLFTIAGTALCGSALAHTGGDAHQHSAFISGLLHPFSGVDHLCAMLAVGMWSAQRAPQGGRGMLLAPLVFAVLMLGGAVLGLRGAVLPGVEPMVAASLLVCGLLLATRLRLSALRAAALVGGFALFHGLAHGDELASQPDAALALAGMLCATVLLHACGLALGWTLRGSRDWIARLSGGGIALLGSALLLSLG